MRVGEKTHTFLSNTIDYWANVASNNDIHASIWSKFDIGCDWDAPHPYPFATHVTYGHEISVPIKGNTWLDIYKAADIAIIMSRDLHHIYIENFMVASNGYELQLITGS